MRKDSLSEWEFLVLNLSPSKKRDITSNGEVVSQKVFWWWTCISLLRDEWKFFLVKLLCIIQALLYRTDKSRRAQQLWETIIHSRLSNIGWQSTKSCCSGIWFPLLVRSSAWTIPEMEFRMRVFPSTTYKSDRSWMLAVVCYTLVFWCFPIL